MLRAGWDDLEAQPQRIDVARGADGVSLASPSFEAVEACPTAAKMQRLAFQRALGAAGCAVVRTTSPEPVGERCLEVQVQGNKH